MPQMSTQPMSDPLAIFIEKMFEEREAHPVPLVSLSFDVNIDSGLAIVTTRRELCNAADESIEALLTFPMPVHATLYSLEAEIDGRLLKARARKKAEAREDYEGAMDRGRTAVLHEEVLKGVHMLSLGQVGPGAKILVITKWAMPLQFVENAGHLRIPLTVGDIYGSSRLRETDEITIGAPSGYAELKVTTASGTIELQGTPSERGKAISTKVPDNRPIDLVIRGFESRQLTGVASDGREVSLRVAQAPSGERPLSVAILIDHSGSMAEISSALAPHSSKHQRVRYGLLSVLAKTLRPGDRVEIWEFNDALNFVGGLVASEGSARRGVSLLLRWLSQPNGGTEIGSAIEGVIGHSRCRDLLVLTDGKSHALEVHSLASLGSRVSAVLIGEDSLEARIGHLATLTGGDVVIAGEEMMGALSACLEEFRVPDVPVPKEKVTHISSLRRIIGNAEINLNWRKQQGVSASAHEPNAISALAAALALPFLEENAAAKLAEEEGIVTHLTSLILVDKSGAGQKGLPRTIKMALPEPATMNLAHDFGARASSGPGTSFARGEVFSKTDWSQGSCWPDESGDRSTPFRRTVKYSIRAFSVRPPAVIKMTPEAVAKARLLIYDTRQIDWAKVAGPLSRDQVPALASDVSTAIEYVASLESISQAASKNGFDARLLVLTLMACAAAPQDRYAARLARALRRRFGDEIILQLAKDLSLPIQLKKMWIWPFA